jgi:hypothetical protein
MPSKRKRDSKDSATKNTFNPPTGGAPASGSQTREPEEQDLKRRAGQYGGSGNPPIMKK